MVSNYIPIARVLLNRDAEFETGAMRKFGLAYFLAKRNVASARWHLYASWSRGKGWITAPVIVIMNSQAARPSSPTSPQDLNDAQTKLFSFQSDGSTDSGKSSLARLDK